MTRLFQTEPFGPLYIELAAAEGDSESTSDETTETPVESPEQEELPEPAADEQESPDEPEQARSCSSRSACAKPAAEALILASDWPATSL